MRSKIMIRYTLVMFLMFCAGLTAFAQPVVTSMAPAQGSPGTMVTIRGSGFNITPSLNIVWFGPTRAAVTTAADTSLTAIVPNGATFGPITVENSITTLSCSSRQYFMPTYDNSPFVPGAVNFDTAVNLTVPGIPYALTIADLDNDSYPDIVSSDVIAPAEVSVFRNNGGSGSISAASFDARLDFSNGYFAMANLTATDIDGNGKLDITGNANGLLIIMHNTSSGSISLVNALDISRPAPVNSAAVGDIDGDGKPDIMFEDHWELMIAQHNTSTPGAISFEQVVLPSFPAGSGSTYAQLADIDGDGRLDLITPGWLALNTTAGPGGASISFGSVIDYSSAYSDAPFAIGDIDGDGKPDVVVSAGITGSVNQFRVYRNTSTIGSVSFESPVTFSTNANVTAVALADIDGDGQLDVVTANRDNNTLSILRHTGAAGIINSGSFAPCVDFAAGPGPFRITIGDLDHDGRPEIIVSNFGGNTISVFHNNPLRPITGNTGICYGGTLALGNATGGGKWSSGDTTVATVDSAGVVTGVAPGTAVITYAGTAIAGIAGNVATVVVTVNALPVVGSTGGNTVICSGSSATLSGTGAATYLWTGGITDGAAFAPAAGIYNYTVTGTDSNGCSNTATTTLTVNATTAGTITGPSAVTVGANITLTDAAGSGTWSASNSNATVVAGLVHGVSAGTVTVSYTVTGVCGSASATRVITVNTVSPAVASITGYYYYLCVGATLPFFDATAGGTWSIGAADAGVASVSAAGVVSGLSAGTARLSYTVGTSYATAVVTVYPVPAAITGAGTICQGQATALSDASPGGVWSSSIPSIATVGTTGLVSSTNAGAVPIYYTFPATGCRATLIVTINPNPAAITGPVKVCMGSSISLSDGTAGGTWSGANMYATVDGLGNVAGLAAGSVDVTYTLATGCVRVLHVPVNQAPAPISGSLSVCAGSKTYLGDAVTPGYSWASSAPAFATVTAAGAVTGVAAGTATLTYTLADACSVTAVVTVNPTPAVTPILGASSVSHGGAGITLSDLTGGGAWTSSNTAILTVGSATGHVTAVVSAGSANINYTVTNGFGCSAAATKAVSTSPAPPAHSGTTTQTTTVGSSVALANEAAGGYWESDDNTIATVDGNGVVTGAAPGIVTIRHTTNDNGSAAVTQTQVIVNPLPFEIKVLPNPNDGAFTIAGKSSFAGTEGNYEITDVAGRVVARGIVALTGGVIDQYIQTGNTLASGVYLLNLQLGETKNVIRFVVGR